MMNFVNKLDLSDQKYQTDENIKYENYKEKLIFTIKGFLSSVTDCQSINIMLDISFKENIDGVHVPQFQLAYIHDTTHPSHKKVKVCREIHYMWWGNQ